MDGSCNLVLNSGIRKYFDLQNFSIWTLPFYENSNLIFQLKAGQIKNNKTKEQALIYSFLSGIFLRVIITISPDASHLTFQQSSRANFQANSSGRIAKQAPR